MTARVLQITPPADPPHAIEAEAALISAILRDNDVIDLVAALSAADFWQPLHAEIFELVRQRRSAGDRNITPPMLLPVLRNSPNFEALEGTKYLARLTEIAFGLFDPVGLANVIREQAFRRQAIDASLELSSACSNPQIPVADLVARLQTMPAIVADTDRVARLSCEWVGEVEPVLDGLWLIDDWLPRSGVAVVYGHPGSGKTFAALHMAAAVAGGREWAGRHVERGLVLYVVAEGQRGFRNRLAAMIHAGELDRNAPFAFVAAPIDLQAPNGDVEKLIGTLRHAADRADTPAALIVIDTLSKTFGAGKENTDDMAVYIANCQRVASAFECLTLVIHHRPKDNESRDLRGHSSLRGGVDTAILVEGDETKTATVIKQKDGEDGVQVSFELERVAIGYDTRGKEISTCLVRVVDAAATPAASGLDRAKRALKGHAKTALREIEGVIASLGEPVPPEIPAAEVDRWKVSRVIRRGHVADTLNKAFADLMESDADKKADTAKRTARRALDTLKSKEILGNWGDWVWLNS